MGRILSRATRRATLAQIRFVEPVRPERAPEPVVRVYEQVEQDFGMLAPPISLHAPAPATLAAAWVMLRECMVATGQVRREVKEAVAVGVSLTNACPYCVEVHSMALYGLTRPADALAVATGRAGEVSDPELQRAASWAAAGPAGPPAAPQRQRPELVGTAVTFHYLNRMSNVFLVESPIPPGVPGAARRAIRRAAGQLLRPVLRRPAEPGAALDLLPPAPLPADLAWAAGNPRLSAAFARAAAAVEAAGRRSVPDPVRKLVDTVLRDPAAGPVGPSRAWVGPVVADLPPADRPVAQFALLTALASYQVTPPVVDELRRQHRDDRSLIEIAAWASLAAARRAAAP